MSSATVLYDSACPLCRDLAAWACRRAKGLTFEAWQTFKESPEARASLPESSLSRPADRLRVYVGAGHLIEGDEAWRYLLERYEDLAGLNWLAQRLGIATGVAQALSGAGRLARRLCFRCGWR